MHIFPTDAPTGGKRGLGRIDTSERGLFRSAQRVGSKHTGATASEVKQCLARSAYCYAESGRRNAEQKPGTKLHCADLLGPGALYAQQYIGEIPSTALAGLANDAKASLDAALSLNA